MIIDNFPEKDHLQTINPERRIKDFKQGGVCGWTLTRDSEGRVLPSVMMYDDQDNPTVAAQLPFKDAAELGLYMLFASKQEAKRLAQYTDGESKQELESIARSITDLVIHNFGNIPALQDESFCKGVAAAKKQAFYAEIGANKAARAAGKRDALKELAPVVQKLADAAVTDSESKKESILGEKDVQELIKKAVAIA